MCPNGRLNFNTGRILAESFFYLRISGERVPGLDIEVLVPSVLTDFSKYRCVMIRVSGPHSSQPLLPKIKPSSQCYDRQIVNGSSPYSDIILGKDIIIPGKGLFTLWDAHLGKLFTSISIR